MEKSFLFYPNINNNAEIQFVFSCLVVVVVVVACWHIKREANHNCLTI